jgi:signal transduction histidine kinase
MTVYDKPVKKAFLIICLFWISYVVTAVANDAGYASDKITDFIKLGLIIVMCTIGYFSGRGFFHFTRTTPIFLLAMSFLIIFHITELTEEFAIFQPVPLFGKASLAKQTFETTLMIGSVCMFLGGIYFSVFAINRAREQQDADVAKLKSLASQLSITEERERHQLATQLHDHIGQSLVISKAKLDEQCEADISRDHKKVLKEVCECLNQVIQNTRTLTFDLSSPLLYMMGFEAAAEQWLIDEIQKKYQIKTKFATDGKPKPLDEDIRGILFRNLRELLINVVKHAKAQKVKVSVLRVDENIQVRVEDDGIGFNPLEIKTESIISGKFGLFSIQERLEQLGGRVEIRSRPGEGCRIIMTAPLKSEKVNNPNPS